MYCEQCDRMERDPVFLDVETCSECGGSLQEADDEDDGQPDEQQEWSDYDPDC